MKTAGRQTCPAFLFVRNLDGRNMNRRLRFRSATAISAGKSLIRLVMTT